jgi:hypothetical protein
MNYFYIVYPIDLYTKYIYYKKVLGLCTIMLDRTAKRVYNRTIVISKGNIYPPPPLYPQYSRQAL